MTERSDTPADPSPRDAAEREPGSLIADKYRVIEVLGRGGFGTVYLVEITAGMVGEKLALKLLPANLSGNPKVRDQFLNEIRVAMRMVDKYIVQVRDVGTTDDGLLYYTMDYCPGKTLSEVIREEGTVPPPRAVAIVQRVLRALRTAHASKIIHRDLKPANVMVSTEGSHDDVRVLDFGIATAIQSGGETTASISGSPHYMPPEQFLGEALGFYSDLYAVGAILYEMLTGRKPYPGSTIKEVFRGLKAGPPPLPESLNPELNDYPRLLAILVRALERNPERRYQTAREFFDDLGSALQPPAEEAEEVDAPRGRRGRRRGRRRRRPTSQPAIVGIILAILVAILAFTFRKELGFGRSDDVTDRTPNPVAPAPAPVVPEPKPRPAAVVRPEPAPQPTAQPRPEPPQPKPFDASELLMQARTAADRKDWAAVISAAGEVYQRERDNHEALVFLGTASYRLEQFAAAERYLSLAREAGASGYDLDAILMLADANTRLSEPDWETAEGLYAEALKRPNVDRKDVLGRLAGALLKQGKDAELRRTLIELGGRDQIPDALKPEWTRLFVDAPRLALAKAAAALAKAEAAQKKYQFRAAHELASPAADALVAIEAYAPSEEVASRRAALQWIAVDAGVNSRSAQHLGAVSKHLDTLEQSETSPESPVGGSDEPPASEPERIARHAELSYYRGRLALARYETNRTAKDARKHLDDAEFRFTEALTDARTLPAKEKTALTRRIGAWRGRVFAHHGNYVQVDLDVRPAHSIADDYEKFEQARTYYIVANNSKNRTTRISALTTAKGRFISAKRSLSGEHLQEAQYLLGLSYLQLGRDEKKSRWFKYATDSFGDAIDSGLETPELFAHCAEAHEEAGDLRRMAAMHRRLFEVQPNAKNCLQAADSVFLTTKNRRLTLEWLEGGLVKLEGKERERVAERIASLRGGNS